MPCRKCPQLDPSLSDINPVQRLEYFSKIHLNTTLPSTPKAPLMVSSPYGFDQTLHFPLSCYMPYPHHPPCLYRRNNILCRTRIMKLLIVQLFRPPLALSVLGQNCFTQHCSQTPRYISVQFYRRQQDSEQNANKQFHILTSTGIKRHNITVLTTRSVT
jgi:hypothetical protein